MRHALALVAPLLLVIPLAGCSSSEPVGEAAQQEVRGFFDQDSYPAPISKMWRASLLKDTLICGRMEPVRDGERHRFYYDLKTHHGQVEMAEVITFDGMGGTILAQNRELFNEMWKDNCAEGESSIF